MYRKTTILLLFLAALFTACKDKKDEDCVAPAIEQNIVGTWQVETDLGPLGKQGGFTANFKPNGELVDQDDVFYIGIDPGNSGPVTRYWQVKDGRVLISDTKTKAPSFEFDVVENTCEKIVLNEDFATVTLTDKK